MKKRLISLLLSAVMVFSLLPLSAVSSFAANGNVINSGGIGGVKYTIYDDGTMEIYGRGNIDYRLWSISYVHNVVSLVIGSGVYNIGGIFDGFDSLNSVTIEGDGVETITPDAFSVLLILKKTTPTV